MAAERAQADQLLLVRPVTRPRTLGQSVYEALLDLVVAGRLQPGQHLAEMELARRLGVSRQPVREALHRLQAEGWVEFRPNGGACVHAPSAREVDELLTVRALLEVEAARLAASRASKRQLARLMSICDAGEAAVRDGDVERFKGANHDFHAALAELSGISALAQLCRDVALRARWHYHKVAPVRMRDSCDEHREIAQAIAAREEKQAATAARVHIEHTRLAYHESIGQEGGPRGDLTSSG
ncbi:MAG: GntR family transcriptional regulator [Nocardiopsaceae bacterium]|jgi:DNA-binding GntR family transcriptional regulator|nr:GntR family transcriptional regulator [Nocardiopsaceae bacterium]